jgi:hypothetical protein
MSKRIGTPAGEPIREEKYARVERERRFLTAGPPPASAVTASRRITDRYLISTHPRVLTTTHRETAGDLPDTLPCRARSGHSRCFNMRTPPSRNK